MDGQKARVTVEDVPGGAKVVIEYDDGHTVYMSVASDSIVLRLHLGLEDAPEALGARREGDTP
jgi:hypothetical protein